MSSEDIGREQRYLSLLYGRLDDLRRLASERRDRALLATGGTPQARVEREAANALYTDQLAQFDAAENRLCFGRLDMSGQTSHAQAENRRYIGRLGLFDESDDYTPLLIDWRAPAARPFYLATAAAPDGVRRRRHIHTAGRRVVGVDDEVLDLAEAAHGEPGRYGGLVGEAALLAAVTAQRTGRMGDIVSTIQAEQDRIIRAPMTGVLVVEGGPGTGKTAVALHRAAFLLYTYRRELAQRGVLVVGPNATFLRYIGQVLPSLGETGVLLSSIGDLYPGVTARRTEPAATAEIKGRLAMVDVLAAAVRDRQRLPDGVREVVVDREPLRLDRAAVERARERARRTGWQHNRARSVFAGHLVDALAGQVANRIGADVLGGPNLLEAGDVEEIRRELRADAEVRAAIEELWPVLTPQRLLADLFADPELIESAAPGLTPAERALLHRDPAGGWTAADAPLLDEAAELLGEDNRAQQARTDRERLLQIEYAEGFLEIAAGSRSIDTEDELDPEVLAVTDLIDASRLAERQEDDVRLTVAERAAADRLWAFGHVIVDEAQELSTMAWRMLMRRCPSRSMTLVGDVAQTGELAGTTSWGGVLAPYVADRWRLTRLTVNYRTPAEIMAVAADVLDGVEPPASVRSTGVPPWSEQVSGPELAARLSVLVKQEADEVGEGRLAVIVPADRLAELGGAVRAAVPAASVGADPELASPVVVLDVKQAKGLEFDAVLVVDPAAIIAASPRGHNDLYVALTRATQRMGVVHPGDLPAVLDRLAPR